VPPTKDVFVLDRFCVCCVGDGLSVTKRNYGHDKNAINIDLFTRKATRFDFGSFHRLGNLLRTRESGVRMTAAFREVH
jgi:hypothetical protein